MDRVAQCWAIEKGCYTRAEDREDSGLTSPFPPYRYYGFKCEVVGTSVGKPLPLIADLQVNPLSSLSSARVG